MRYFEDFRAGETIELAPVTVSESEIVEFARRYDPQPFHVDPAAAAAGPFGGLIASGWHTAALFMRGFVESVLTDSASMGSPGIEELRWTAPVRPGDTLTGRVTITDMQPSSKRSDRGTAFTNCDVVNQDGTVVMSFRARTFFGRRPD